MKNIITDTHGLRSIRFTPANKPDLFPKTLHSKADLVLFDLEDAAVAGPSKEEARQHLQHLLADYSKPTGFGIRINGLNTLDGLKDILLLSNAARLPEVLVIPKSGAQFLPLLPSPSIRDYKRLISKARRWRGRHRYCGWKMSIKKKQPGSLLIY